MKKVLWILFASMIALGGSSLQAKVSSGASAASAVDPKAIEAAKRLLVDMNMQKSYGRIVSQASDVFIRHYPRLASAKGKIQAFYDKYIGWEAIKEDLARIYARHYSAKELDELRAFYRTPLGRKVLQTMPETIREGRELGERRVRAHISELTRIIKETVGSQKK